MNGGSGYGIRIGIGGAVLLITLIGGRIIPSFTRNWLARQSPGRLPIAFGPFDVASLAIGALAIACWIAYPHAPANRWFGRSGWRVARAAPCAMGRLSHHW